MPTMMLKMHLNLRMQNVTNTAEEMASLVWVKRAQLNQKIYTKQ